MRRSQVILVAAVAVLAVATIALFISYQNTKGQLASTKTSEQGVRDEYAQTLDAIAEIQDSLNAISLGDTSVAGQRWNQETGEKFAHPTGKEALDRIALMRASIARNRERIAALEEDLKERGVKVASLNRMVSNLKRSVADKEVLVAQLTAENNNLKTEVVTLNTTVQQTQDTLRVRDETLVQKQRELATVFVAVGDKDELKQAGVIETKGGVLGIGKTVQPVASASEYAFRPMNTDQEKVVYIGSADKARVISAQTPTSYELREVAGQWELRITDPEEFRKIKQVVILTG